MKTVVIDGVEYEEKKKESDIKIVVLQRGWVMVGRFSRDGSDCILTDACNIRNWGTSKGLGELATEGKLLNTKLDPYGTVKFDYLTVVCTIDCEGDKWGNVL